jgi:hypothetical protein
MLGHASFQPAIALSTMALSGMGLAGCASEAPQPETVDEFAARVGAQKPGAAQTAAAAPQAAPASATAPAAQQASVLQLESLGSIAELDLGPTEAGGCTFSSAGTNMMAAFGPPDKTMSGKATVRVGGQLRVLDAPPGGYDTIRAGTVFNGEGFSVLVSPAGGERAKLTVTDNGGQQSVFDGKWVCV